MGTDLATTDPSKYLALSSSAQEVAEILADTFTGQQVSAWDLPRAPMPSGGALQWTMESPLTGTVSVSELEGIVVAHRVGRAYWENDDVLGQPPNCSSDDGVTGRGNPGGSCDTCPLSDFGSDSKERGQACKQQQIVLMLRPDNFIPLVIALPPTSLRAWKQYIIALGGAAIRPWRVVTSLSLAADRNSDGVRFARAVPRVVARLEPEVAAAAGAYAEQIRPIFAPRQSDAAAAPAPADVDGSVVDDEATTDKRTRGGE